MEVKFNSKIGEKGLFATKIYPESSVVFILDGNIVNKPTRESIKIGENLHIIDNLGIYMNHSFLPTCKIESVNVIALKNIEPGDEINFNYNENEIDMACPFEVNGIHVHGIKINKNQK